MTLIKSVHLLKGSEEEKGLWFEWTEGPAAAIVEYADEALHLG